MKKLNLSDIELKMLQENNDIIDELYSITLLDNLDNLKFTRLSVVEFYRSNKALRDLHRWLLENYFPYLTQTATYFKCKGIERILTRYLSKVKNPVNLEVVIDEIITNLKNTY